LLPVPSVLTTLSRDRKAEAADRTPIGGTSIETRDPGLLPLNVATIALVDELLMLPSGVGAATAARLLWGPEMTLPDSLLDLVGHGVRLPLGSLLALPGPLAALVPSRLRLIGRWEDPATALRGARVLGTARYRQLQTAFVGITAQREPRRAPSLVRYTYGTAGQPWLWTESSRRISNAVFALNREALALLGPGAGAGARGLPDAVLGALAAALPPLAVPDFSRLAAALSAPAAGGGDETAERYRSLFAEMLGLMCDPEEC
jgi:hypothetical protein